ncbi:MAG: prolipoprotein diacylglyceryl transferase [Armatimonadetes bacterium]|nr:prolipoprotein diacylglyceryl transferase [Armatimonadota bacterium]
MHPVLFHAGPITLRSYGVMVMCGFLVALWYVMGAARRAQAARPEGSPPGITPEQVFDASLVGLVAGIIGTRVLYVALNWGFYSHNPLAAFQIWNGGLSFIGAPIFGFGYCAFYCKRHGLRFLEVADMASAGFAVAYAIGRIGCFLNGCCYGVACNLPWAVRFHADGNATILTPPSHPTQIYSAIASLAAFFALDAGLKRPHKRGVIFVGYLLFYAVYRFFVEGLRKGATAEVFRWQLTDAQVFSLVIAPILACVLIALIRRSDAAPGSDAKGPGSPPERP